MEWHFACFIFRTNILSHAQSIRVLRIVVVRIRVVNLVFSLVENLEFHKVETLLYEVDISKMLQVQNKLSDCSQRHIMVFTSDINGCSTKYIKK